MKQQPPSPTELISTGLLVKTVQELSLARDITAEMYMVRSVATMALASVHRHEKVREDTHHGGGSVLKTTQTKMFTILAGKPLAEEENPTR